MSADTITSNAAVDVAQVGRQFTFDQFVVDIPGPGLSDHRCGQVDSHQSARIRRDERSAQAGAAAGIEHIEALRRLDIRVRQHLRDQRRRAVRQLGELGVEAGGEAVERLLDERVRCPRRDIAAGAGRQHVPGNGTVRLLFQPLFEDFDRLVDFTERAVRYRQQSARFGILRPQRDDLREADGRFVRPLLAGQQDAQVVVRVRVLRIDADGGSICRFGFDRLVLGPQDNAEIVVRVGMVRIERNRASIRDDRIVQLESILQDDPEIAVPVRAIGLELETPLDQRDCLARSAPADARALLRSATHRRSRARRRGWCGRCPPPPPTARSAAAGWRSRALRPG